MSKKKQKRVDTSIGVITDPVIRINASKINGTPSALLVRPLLTDEWLSEHIVLDGFDSIEDAREAIFVDTIVSRVQQKAEMKHDWTEDQVQSAFDTIYITVVRRETDVQSVAEFLAAHPEFADVPNIRKLMESLLPGVRIVD